MLMQGAVLILTSTPPINESPCDSIKKGMYNGERICNFMNFQLTCDDCMPIVEKNREYKCRHRGGWRPAMHNEEILGICEAAVGDTEVFQREFMATVIKGTNNYFPSDYTKRLRASELYDLKRPPEYLFISIDPASSSVNPDGISSYFAIVTMFFVDGQAVVIYVQKKSVFFLFLIISGWCVFQISVW